LSPGGTNADLYLHASASCDENNPLKHPPKLRHLQPLDELFDTWQTKSEPPCRLMREVATKPAMPVTITTGGELTDLEYRQKLGPWIRKIISTASRRYTAGRGPRKCQCKQCVVSGDPSKAADTEIWICTSCGYAGCSIKDHGGAMEHWGKADHRFAMRIPTGVVANERLMFTQTEIWDYQQGKYLKKQACSEPKALASICGPTLGGLAGPMLPNHKGKVGSKDIESAQEHVDILQRLVPRVTPAVEVYDESDTSSYPFSHNVNKSGSNLFNRRFDYADI
jgi:hypothetical protein